MKSKCAFCGHNNMEGEDRCESCLHSLMQLTIPRPKGKDHFQDALLDRPVADLLTGKDLRVCAPDDTVEQVVRIFQNDKKSCVLVYEKKKLVGILSQRDLVLRVTGLHKDLAKVKVREVMTKNPGSVRPEDPIAFAVNRMAMGGYRHVPVLRPDGTPVSVLLIRDVLRFLSQQKKGGG